MKIVNKTFCDMTDFRAFYKLEVDGERKAFFYDGEPEDANLSRDFSDVYSIVELMKMAYEAGQSGEELEIEQIECKSFEEFE